MFDIAQIINVPPFSLAQDNKIALYQEALYQLTKHHYVNCALYQKILDRLNFNISIQCAINEIPFIPVRLFKDYELLSVDPLEIIKTMISSGTTGQRVSKIFLDRITATNQTKVLAKIVSHFIGTKRLPLLIIDTQDVIKNRHLFSARGAGILGFSMLGYDITYALDEKMQLNLQGIKAFYEKYKNQDVLLFGFTYIVWEYFYKALAQMQESFFFEKGILLHGGGWKKLSEQMVDNDVFKQSLLDVCGIKRIHNYYGMVEQTGSIFVECEAGYLHSSIFSDVIIRDIHFTECQRGEKGLIQLLSLLPWSYPGHSILSEDMGEIVGEDDCSCGRLGKYFKIHGRIKNAEVRGCSDTQN